MFFEFDFSYFFLPGQPKSVSKVDQGKNSDYLDYESYNFNYVYLSCLPSGFGMSHGCTKTEQFNSSQVLENAIVYEYND